MSTSDHARRDLLAMAILLGDTLRYWAEAEARESGAKPDAPNSDRDGVCA